MKSFSDAIIVSRLHVLFCAFTFYFIVFSITIYPPTPSAPSTLSPTITTLLSVSVSFLLFSFLLDPSIPPIHIVLFFNKLPFTCHRGFL